MFIKRVKQAGYNLTGPQLTELMAGLKMSPDCNKCVCVCVVSVCLCVHVPVFARACMGASARAVMCSASSRRWRFYFWSCVQVHICSAAFWRHPVAHFFFTNLSCLFLMFIPIGPIDTLQKFL